MKKMRWRHLVVVAGLSWLPTTASADFIRTISGNDCSGVFGQSFGNCTIPSQYDPDQSPVIIKFDRLNNGSFTTEINTDLFPSIDGSEFSFSFTGNGSTGTWTYTPGDDDPIINFFVAKGGPNFNLFSNLGDPNTDTWLTPNNGGGNPAGLSHLTFYDGGITPPQEIPEPGTLALLGLGLLGFSALRRRSKQ